MFHVSNGSLVMAKKEVFMKKAIELAKLGAGLVSPNPLVGALVVKNGRIIGEGYHAVYGGPHAEVNAIENASEDVGGATLYCTLEPCCHTNKQTPPCTDLIIKKNIAKVIICNVDPNPFVDGGGIKKLIDAGIQVESGIHENIGSQINEVFFKFIKTKTPFVHLKLAHTLDGKIATADGDSKWISDESARKVVHEYRMKYDAVLVGRNTLCIDNPALDIRMGVENKGKIPYRIVLGNPGKMNFDYKILSDEYSTKTVICCKLSDYEKLSDDVLNLITLRNIKVITANCYADGGINLDEVLKKLGDMKIASILVEGGTSVFSSFLNNNLYDRITLFIAPKLIGNGESFFSNDGIKLMKDAITFNNLEVSNLNNQIVLDIRK